MVNPSDGDDVVCDYGASLKDVAEYLDNQGAYDLFDMMLKELLKNQPDDPLQYMIDCLKTELPTGPLRVMVVSASGANRRHWSSKIAEQYGLKHISPGKLLQDAGIDVNKIAFADDEQVIKLVKPELEDAAARMQGWVLDGFPRTNRQASFLREMHIKPTHVYLLNAPKELICKMNEDRTMGRAEGAPIPDEMLEQKLKMHSRHALPAIEAYMDRTLQIYLDNTDAEIWHELQKSLKTRNYSKAPRRAPRVVLLGPPGSRALEYAEGLAAQLGAVVVDGSVLEADLPPALDPSDSTDRLLEAVLTRLAQVDCKEYGWVLTNFPKEAAQATRMCQGEYAPIRSIVLKADIESCKRYLHDQAVDPVTGKHWSERPKSEVIRKRLIKDKQNHPEKVALRYRAFEKAVHEIYPILSAGGSGVHINTEGETNTVAHDIAEFVERPLPFEFLSL